MNPYAVLDIAPTTDKSALRRAFIKQIKKHHPDLGGDPTKLDQIQDAYHGLVDGTLVPGIKRINLSVSLADLFHGCVAKAIINETEVIEFVIPSMTYPKTTIEFYNKSSTFEKIYVNINEIKEENVIRRNEHIVITSHINTNEAVTGVDVNITNFDGTTHTVNVAPHTTADTLFYFIKGNGFFNKKTKVRGDLTIIINKG